MVAGWLKVFGFRRRDTHTTIRVRHESDRVDAFRFAKVE